MNKGFARFHVLSTAIFLCGLQHASGHSYVYWPASRNRKKFFYLAQSQNSPGNAGDVNPESGFSDLKSKHGAPPDGRTGPRSDTAWAWDLCGQGPDPGNQKIGDSWKNWAGPPVETYKQGGQITFTLVVNGEHGGAHEFRLCPKKVDDSMTVKEAAECLDMYLIGRDCTPGEGCGCKDDKCKKNTPHNDKNDPIYTHGNPDFLAYGAHQFTYTLPKDVVCDECTIQWYWATAFGEWFRNCIDIKIEGNGQPTQPPPTVSPPRRRRNSTRRRRRRRRRRKSTRRRGNRRRRRSSRRRKSAKAAATTATAERDTVVDIEYEEVGCFPLTQGDTAAEGELPCDCDTGSGPRLYDTAPRDYTCMNRGRGTVCRSGLPFYRLMVNKDASDRLCFSFCSTKGADLFGILGWSNKSAPSVECRCGASMTNYKFWKTAGHEFKKDVALPHSSLLLDRSTMLQECSKDSVRVYSYEGWKALPGSSGVPDAMLDYGDEDQDYMTSIVKGHQIKKGQPV